MEKWLNKFAWWAYCSLGVLFADLIVLVAGIRTVITTFIMFASWVSASVSFMFFIIFFLRRELIENDIK